MFQFQTGAIKRTRESDGTHRKAQFQFQTGAIKSQRGIAYDFETDVSIPNWCD